MRYQNHLTPFGILPQLLQDFEQILTQDAIVAPPCKAIKAGKKVATLSHTRCVQTQNGTMSAQGYIRQLRHLLDFARQHPNEPGVREALGDFLAPHPFSQRTQKGQLTKQVSDEAYAARMNQLIAWDKNELTTQAFYDFLGTKPPERKKCAPSEIRTSRQHSQCQKSNRVFSFNTNGKRRGKKRKRPKRVQIRYCAEADVINRQTRDRNQHVILARGKTVESSLTKAIQYAIDVEKFKKTISSLPINPHSSQHRAHFTACVSRTLAAIQRMVRADRESGLFCGHDDAKGLFALVGLHADGSKRDFVRVKAFMGKHVDNASLGEKLEHVTDLLTYTEPMKRCTKTVKKQKVDYLESIGPIIEILEEPMTLTGEMLNASNPEDMHRVRGGKWIVARLNPELFGPGKPFVQLDERAFDLSFDSAFNTYVNIKAAQHYKFKQSNELAQTIELHSQELLERSGLAQLTRTYKRTHGTWRERKSLKRALETLVEIGLLTHFEFLEDRRPHQSNLRISLPPRPKD